MNRFLALCLFSQACFGYDPYAPQNTYQDPCSACPDPCEVPCMPPKKSPKPSFCGYNAPYILDVNCPWDTYISASYLLWEAKMDNTHFADVLIQNDDNLELMFSKSSFSTSRYDVNNRFCSGFKVGLGILANCDHWDLFAEYTFHRSKENNCVDISESAFSSDGSNTITKVIDGYFLTGMELQSTVYGDQENFFPFVASGKWRVDLDMGDLEVGRKFYVGKCVLLRPLTSLRLTFLRQQYDAEYSGPISTSAQEAFLNAGEQNGRFVSNRTNQVESWAIGPRFGLDLDWQMWRNIHILSDASTSVLYTHYYKIKDEGLFSLYDDFNSLLLQSNNTNDENKTFCSIRPQLQASLGASWGCYFDCYRWFFDIYAGYSVFVLWNQNFFYDSYNEYNRNSSVLNTGTVLEKTNRPMFFRGGDLVYHGLRVTFNLHF